MNRLHCGDNLKWLSGRTPTEAADARQKQTEML
jgi:hypothetical protein